jgi:hypothetical protein
MGVDWRIYYSDSTYDGPVENAPERDVQVIVKADERVGWAMCHASDYYLWEYDTWRGADIFGLFDYLARSGWKRVLFGRTLKHEEFNAIYQRAKADRDFARKSSFLPSERKP